MSGKENEDVRKTLAEAEVHKKWARDYRIPENEAFFDLAFDYITNYLQAPPDSTVLDAGCGTCSHSIRMARRGFQVVAADFSESALDQARQIVTENNLDDAITIRHEDLCSFSFADGAFAYALCWGVFMHIPDVDKAVAELARVIQPGGFAVVGENNMFSLDSMLLRFLKKAMGRATGKSEPEGIEHWVETNSGRLLSRECRPSWLVHQFSRHGMKLRKRVARQFTENYIRVPSSSLKSLIHRYNNFWFRHIRLPQPACGNLFIFQKDD